MALSLETQWTLVASGLMAHADNVLTGEECDRLMAMVDAEIEGDDYVEWMGTISDAERLESLFASLPKPPADSHRQILEEAWLMSVVDGERADEEVAVLERIAAHFGVEPVQLEFWREAWTTAQSGYAESAAHAMGWVLGGGEAVAEADGGVVSEFLHALPTTHEHREELAKIGVEAQSQDEVERRARALGAPQKRDLIHRLRGLVEGASQPGPAEERWRALAGILRLSAEEIDRIAQQ